MDEPVRAQADELALCLSGGGYRAMLFHLGALWRLNEAGQLSKLDRISSVSGGSIAAGVLAHRWRQLDFDANGVAQAFVETVAHDLHRMAGHTIDVRAGLRGVLGPGTVGDAVARAYRRRLFGSATLQTLPDEPRFVFCATSLQTGSLWRFSKPYMADYRLGMVLAPTVPLATAVAASSAFPPFLSPVVLKLPEGAFSPDRRGPLYSEELARQIVLSDGGVYDNLGLQPALGAAKTVFVSDGGGAATPVARPRHVWPFQLLRIVKVLDQQVRARRSSELIADFIRPDALDGAYWGIRTPMEKYKNHSALPAPAAHTSVLAATPTRLARMDRVLQRRLVNWGYAVSDAALRTYADQTLADPSGFPYPKEGI